MTALVRAPEATRRVRIVIEGEARPLSHAPDLLRVSTGGRTLVVDTAGAGVTVEDVQDRAWTDGDVVAGKVTVWTRTDGKWAAVGPFGVDYATDADIDRELAAGAWRVLRHQVGGDE